MENTIRVSRSYNQMESIPLDKYMKNSSCGIPQATGPVKTDRMEITFINRLKPNQSPPFLMSFAASHSADGTALKIPSPFA